MMRSGLVLASAAGLCLSACKSGRVSGYRLVSEPAYEYAEAPEKLRDLAIAAETKSEEKARAIGDRRRMTGEVTPRRVLDDLAKSRDKTTEDRMDEVELRSLDLRASEYSKAHRQLAEALAEGDILYTEKLFFTVEPLIAFDGDLATTAIPALGVNWRFLERCETPLAAQLVMGGALNPQASGRDVGAAIGLGISHPVSRKGSISIGYVWWDEAGDGEDGFYIGITLGDFGKKPERPR